MHDVLLKMIACFVFLCCYYSIELGDILVDDGILPDPPVDNDKNETADEIPPSPPDVTAAEDDDDDVDLS